MSSRMLSLLGLLALCTASVVPATASAGTKGGAKAHKRSAKPPNKHSSGNQSDPWNNGGHDDGDRDRDVAVDVLTLDTHEDPQQGAGAGPVYTNKPLANDKLYVVTVHGTMSAFPANLYVEREVCGTAEPSPIYPSPNTTNGPVGQDAEVIFARPKPLFAPCPALPTHYTGFQMDLGSGFAHMEPIRGPKEQPNKHHLYFYFVRGEGKPMGFTQLDTTTSDNYGKYLIGVFRASKNSHCWGGKWAEYGKFASQSSCDKFADSQGTSDASVLSQNAGPAVNHEALAG